MHCVVADGWQTMEKSYGKHDRFLIHGAIWWLIDRRIVHFPLPSQFVSQNGLISFACWASFRIWFQVSCGSHYSCGEIENLSQLSMEGKSESLICMQQITVESFQRSDFRRFSPLPNPPQSRLTFRNTYAKQSIKEIDWKTKPNRMFDPAQPHTFGIAEEDESMQSHHFECTTRTFAYPLILTLKMQPFVSTRMQRWSPKVHARLRTTLSKMWHVTQSSRRESSTKCRLAENSRGKGSFTSAATRDHLNDSQKNRATTFRAFPIGCIQVRWCHSS